MLIRFQALTPWTGTGTEANPNRPLLATAHPLARWIDATAQPSANLQPDPNLYVIEALATPEAFEAISDDPRFFVLWSETF